MPMVEVMVPGMAGRAGVGQKHWRKFPMSVELNC